MDTTMWWMTMAAAGVAWSLVAAGGALGGGCEIVAPSGARWTGAAGPGGVPPIDRDRPSRTETAVFGLG